MIPEPGFQKPMLIAVHRRWHGSGVSAREHELQDCHLGGGILHGNAIRAQSEVGGAAIELLFRIGEVAEEHLFSQRERAIQTAPNDGQAFAGGVVNRLDKLGGGFDGRHEVISFVGRGASGAPAAVRRVFYIHPAHPVLSS